MNLKKITPKLFAALACAGVGMTAYLAAKASPEAKKAVEESGVQTWKEKVKVGFKYYIPTMASGVITVAAIVADHCYLVRKNTTLAIAYGFGQTALNLYAERATPQVRKEVTQEVIKNQVIPEELNVNTIPEDKACQFYDYLSNRDCYMSRTQITAALNEFKQKYLEVDGKGSLNQLYSCFHGTAIETDIGPFGDSHGWKYVNNQGPVPLIYAGFNRQGLPCIVLDYENPPQPGFDNEFA